MQHDSFIIDGLSGAVSLEGEVQASGAKNAVLKAMAASPLFKGVLRLSRVPAIEDVSRLAELIGALGATVSRAGSTCEIDADRYSSADLDHTLAKRLRASVVMTGPLLARFGRVSFPYPGGCVIGTRPIDLFLENFAKMGAEISEDGERYTVTAKGGTLKGAEIFFRLQSVTGTETFMMTAVLAKGTTVLRNCAMEPEIEHLAAFLNRSGARIKGAGTPTITIEGGGLLSCADPYETMSDRIEAGSFLVLAALAGKDVTISRCVPEHFEALIEMLRYAGVPIEVGKDSVRVARKKAVPYRAVNIRTHEYPGFPTDLQAPAVIFLTQAVGESTVFETIFEGRLSYTEDLARMGADIRMFDTQRAVIKGPTPLRGKSLEGPDLRAGLAYIIAGTIASGRTEVANAYQVDRGYENIESRLASLGVRITRQSS